jgi:hypothetical protein
MVFEGKPLNWLFTGSDEPPVVTSGLRPLAVVGITERAAAVTGLSGEQLRYYLQHALGFQVHDVPHPHHLRRHGRADLGWGEGAAS